MQEIRTTRRRVAKGMAWAVPAVTLAAAVPAFAASTCQSVSLGNQLNANGWVSTQTGTFLGGNAWWYGPSDFNVPAQTSSPDCQNATSPARTLKGPHIQFVGNATSADAALYYAKQLNLVANVSYTFTAPYATYGGYNHQETVKMGFASSVPATGEPKWISTTDSVTTRTGTNDFGQMQVTYVIPISQTAYFVFYVTYPAPLASTATACDKATNDVGIALLAMKCAVRMY